jgi:hypothetical protein
MVIKVLVVLVVVEALNGTIGQVLVVVVGIQAEVVVFILALVVVVVLFHLSLDHHLEQMQATAT